MCDCEENYREKKIGLCWARKLQQISLNRLKTSPIQQAKLPGKRGFWAHTPSVEKETLKCLAVLQLTKESKE